MTDDESTKSELKERIAKLEKAVYPSRRDMLKAGAGAAVGGAAVFGATGGASAGSQSAGVIGTQNKPLDGYVEDLYDHNGNNALSLPGDGSVSIGEADITNETYVKAERTTEKTGVSAGTFVNVVDTELEDSRGEFNSSHQFVPDESGEYLVNWKGQLTGGASGDRVDIKIRNVTDGADVDDSLVVHEPLDMSGFPIPLYWTVATLTAGKSYEVQVTDKSSSFTVDNNNSRLLITRSVIHP